mgnify:CR=1 FL=1
MKIYAIKIKDELLWVKAVLIDNKITAIMSENLIIFDEQYVAEQIKRISQAQKLVEEALNIIRKANQHKTWQCEERYKIDESMNILANIVIVLLTIVSNKTLFISSSISSTSLNKPCSIIMKVLPLTTT